MELLIPQWQGVPGNVGAFSTLRQGGYSPAPYDDGSGQGGFNLGAHVQDDPRNVAGNRQLLRSILPTEPVWLNQVHGTNVVDASTVAGVVDADASISTQAGVVCVMMTADCLPVLFCDVDGCVVGAAHAGWRGLAAGILENTVAAMRARGAGEMMAWLGPAIGPRQFEVGQEVLHAFLALDEASRTAFDPIIGSDNKFLADIYQLARQKLARIGVHRVSGGGLCTVSDPRFYSYRRDRQTGRMASLIWLK
ncbi:hypothetical protein FHW67_000192 [Herbaspirillum sp. Sphag1AN]|uniref:peptidoglycan editing factor PgeF n=1 Tax=unclassified Herbaspirillum TaxID=2624150 RepID=UPI00160DACD8|nr:MULTISPECIES: peptidoglycan editing factor PgeF [unclassified Herbaspirillum]MBB3210957.1 hypothetical protein [Herbaspirillum sp. Sphag1AN]MBB3244586.1 hypothetical protein [Herbaspirillum sp. Sphag64]